MKKITISSIPTSIEDFIVLRNEIAISPEGGAAIFLLAMKLYVENSEFGNQSIIAAVDRDKLTEGDVYKGFQLMNSAKSLFESQLKKNILIPNSYIAGATPENNYVVNLPYVYEFSVNKYSGNEADGNIKLFVRSFGADSDRPIHLQKNNRGLWKVSNWSSVIVGIKKAPVDDDI